MEILSLWDVREIKSGKEYEEAIEAVGQEAIDYLRGEYPKLSVFILKGYEIDGVFRKLNLRTYNNIA